MNRYVELGAWAIAPDNSSFTPSIIHHLREIYRQDSVETPGVPALEKIAGASDVGAVWIGKEQPSGIEPWRIALRLRAHGYQRLLLLERPDDGMNDLLESILDHAVRTCSPRRTWVYDPSKNCLRSQLVTAGIVAYAHEQGHLDQGR